jgi:hypothetical protein
MNSAEGQGQNQNQDKNIFQRIIESRPVKRIVAIAGVTTMLSGLPACNSETPNKTNGPTAIETDQTTPEPTDSSTSTAEVTVSPSGEVTVTLKASPSPEITDKATLEPTDKPTKRPTKEPTASPSPTAEETLDPNPSQQEPPPTDPNTTPEVTPAVENPVVVNDNKLLDMYKDVTKDCQEKNRITVSRGLYAIDNNSGFSDEGANYFGGKNTVNNFITKEALIHWGVTDEGLNVWKEGDYTVIKLNCDDPEIDKCFNDANAWYKEHGAPNLVKSLYKNGVCFLLPFRFNLETGPAMAALDQYGTIGFNFDKDVLKELGSKIVTNCIKRDIIVESFGISYMKMDGLSGSNQGCVEIGKSLWVADYYKRQYKNDGDSWYKNSSETFQLMAQQFVDEFGIKLDDPRIVGDTEKIKDNNWLAVPGFDNCTQWMK